MRRMGAPLAAALFLCLQATATLAAVPQEVRTEIAFLEGCAGQGYVIGWSRDEHSSFDDVLAEIGRLDADQLLRWDGRRPISRLSIGTSEIEADYALTLVAADGKSVLYEATYEYVHDEFGGGFLHQAVLDCSSIPYSPVSPDTALPISRVGFSALIGVLAMTLAVVISLCRIRRANT